MKVEIDCVKNYFSPFMRYSIRSFNESFSKSAGVICFDLVEALPLDEDLFFGDALLRAASAFFALLLMTGDAFPPGDARRASILASNASLAEFESFVGEVRPLDLVRVAPREALFLGTTISCSSSDSEESDDNGDGGATTFFLRRAASALFALLLMTGDAFFLGELFFLAGALFLLLLLPEFLFLAGLGDRLLAILASNSSSSSSSVSSSSGFSQLAMVSLRDSVFLWCQVARGVHSEDSIQHMYLRGRAKEKPPQQQQ